LSLSSKSYRLFSKGKTPIQVAITLNLTETETTKFYQEYWNLEQMHELRMVYEEIGANIVHFLKLYRLSKDVHMIPRQVINLLQIATNDLQSVEQRYKKLQRNIEYFKSKTLDANITMEELKSQIQTARQILDYYYLSCQKEKQNTTVAQTKHKTKFYSKTVEE
jgi:hypothetical protein